MTSAVPSIFDFYRGRRVFVTGHTGFKGAWLALWLKHHGAKVSGLALPPETTLNLFDLAGVGDGIDSHLCDINDMASLRAALTAAEPEIVFHLAAQALVQRSFEQPLETYASNVLGTASLLDAIRAVPTMGRAACRSWALLRT